MMDIERDIVFESEDSSGEESYSFKILEIDDDGEYGLRLYTDGDECGMSAGYHLYELIAEGYEWIKEQKGGFNA